jgi:hypothetical protein
MAIQLLPSAPGTRPYEGSFGDLGRALASGIESYQTSKRAKLTDTLNKLLLRGELSGSFGTVSPSERLALRELVGLDETQIAPTELGRRIKALEGISPQIAGLSRVQQQLLGIKVPDPVEERKRYLDTLDAMAKNAERMGLKEFTPPPSVQAEWETHLGEPYPTEATADPTSGLQFSRPKPYRLAKAETAEEVAKMIPELLRSAVSHDLDEDETRTLIESALIGRLGPNWRQERPDTAATVDAVYQQYGIPAPSTAPGGTLPGGLTPGGVTTPARHPIPAFLSGLMDKLKGRRAEASTNGAPTPTTQVPTITAEQRATYNAARAAGKSVDEARRSAGF